MSKPIQSTETVDVVVVGAGFAGAIAARDSTEAGHTVVVLEGRDRVSGRTWYRKFEGKEQWIEVGGTWVAPSQQPHVKTEVERYGIELFQSPEPRAFAWGIDGEMSNAAFPIPAAEWPALERAVARIDQDADRIRLYEEPLGQEGLDDLDIPFTEYVDTLGLAPKSRDFILAWPAFYFGAYPEKLSALHVISWVTAFGSCTGWFTLLTDKFVGGTTGFVERILADAGADVRLNTAVASIDDEGEQVRVTTRSGEEILAKSVIVTAPINAWNTIQFTPELPTAYRAMGEEKQAGESVKVWVLVPALETDFYGVGLHTTFKWIASEYTTEDGTYLCAFASAEKDLDATDPDAVEAAVREFLPDAKVLASDTHDWNNDEFSQGTWMAYRPGQVMEYSAGLQVPHGRIHFANSDLASGWAGWIDGAIESGLRAAKQSNDLLGK
ncbi:flavin monoamine oxidase family protein [Gulosibacter molinativorax]|uniref:FAD-dependent oxidoreductase n=1 Tax=Gulosibacter molinativorax TaxID=256821 RepID=A0ABT7CAR8_9MICO|nr:NAD(P)/FAD-dependent oxidoreductase [Gulosibacter molinativorax]MDJ1372290.1 FAD-dependent oxidoreductase [Gulosibacter molinativorax]QUY63384.1 Amino acid oxidase [Gulosibacter molinativorax]